MNNKYNINTIKMEKMKIIRTFEDAFTIGKECLTEINNMKPRPRLLDDYSLPLNIDDGPWAMTEDALYQTLSYIMNFLNHSCYMLCVRGEKHELFKLETQTMSPFFQDILEREVRRKHDLKITGQLMDENGHLKKMRIMQCIIKEFAETSGTSKEYQELLEKMRLPDGVYILNLTDAVILRKNGLIPWKLNKNVELPKEYKFDKFIPVLSISGEVGYWDIPIPNYDDVQYILESHHADPQYEMNWSKKKPKAVFRGGPTGCGVSENTNMRIKLAKMGKEPKYASWLDVGIVVKNPKATSIDSDAIRYDPNVGLAYMNTYIKPVARMTMSDQSKFKYIIHIDGNVHAYRLLNTMRTGSLILRVKSEYISWIDHLLDQEHGRGNQTYISVKSDLSDLINKIEYCEKHSEECRLIAERATQFAEKVMTPSFVINAFESVVWKLNEIIGSLLFNTPASLTLAEQRQNQRFAIVGKEGEPKEYFVQNKEDEKWRSDPIIQSIINMNVRNSDDILCVLQDMCFANSFNNAKNKKVSLKDEPSQCISEEMALNNISTNLLEQFYNNFDNAYFLSKEELDVSIEKEEQYSKYIYPVLEYIQSAEKLVYNNFKYKIGKTAVVINLPISPIQDMVNLILSDTDESRKRRLLINLVDSKKYVYQGITTQDSLIYGGKESEWWYYCVQTHVQLIPTFMYILATASIQPDANEYDRIRSNLLKEIGQVTDDGIYDKHTGILIENIPFDTEEGFDDSGFKTVTRSILEPDKEKIDEPRKTSERKYAMLVGEELDNFSVNADLLISSNREELDAPTISGNKLFDWINSQTFQLQLSASIINSFMEFLQIANENADTSVDEHKNKRLYFYSVIAIYVFITEKMLSKRTIVKKITDSEHSSKIKEENKYKGGDITKFINKYIAQVVHHSIQSEDNKIDPNFFTKGTVKEIEEFIGNNKQETKINQYIEESKIAPIIEHELSAQYTKISQSVIPQTVWEHFLPIQNPQLLLSITACNELSKLERGKNNTNNNTYWFGKIIFLSFCIQRLIQEILNTENINYYKQLTCCFEQVEIHKYSMFGTTLEYFNEKSPNHDNLSRYNNFIKNIEIKLLQVRSISQSVLFNVDTKIQYPQLSTSLNDVVIKEGLEYLSSRVSPDVVEKTGSAQIEKIQFMQEYKEYSTHTLHNPPEFLDEHLPNYRLIHILLEDTTNAKDRQIGELLKIVYETQNKDIQNDPNQEQKEDTTKMQEIIHIIDKIVDNSKHNVDFDIFVIPGNDEKIDMNNIYTMFAFCRNYILLICNVFPMIFTNATPPLLIKNIEQTVSKNKNSSWFGFASSHIDTLNDKINKKYAEVYKFFETTNLMKPSTKKIVNRYLHNIMTKTKRIAQLSATTYSANTSKGFLNITLKLFQYYISSVFEIYDAEIQHTLEESKNEAKDVEEEEEEEEEEELNVNEKERENKKALKNANKLLLSFFIGYFKTTATTDVINSTYQKISDIAFKHREDEKNKFRTRLEKMEKIELDMYEANRTIGAGEYNITNYKGLKTYNPEFYEKTKGMRDALEATQGEEPEAYNAFDEDQEAYEMATGNRDEDDDYDNVLDDN